MNSPGRVIGFVNAAHFIDQLFDADLSRPRSS